VNTLINTPEFYKHAISDFSVTMCLLEGKANFNSMVLDVLLKLFPVLKKHATGKRPSLRTAILRIELIF
jgi:hypothetical protein